MAINEHGGTQGTRIVRCWSDRPLNPGDEWYSLKYETAKGRCALAKGTRDQYAS